MNTDTPAIGISAWRGFDITQPAIARVYDYWLGGKDNFEADREAAQRLLEIYPDVARLARANRAFLHRAVTHLAASQGIRQFLDIGSGLPTANNTHQIAQAVAPDARVVYVDSDPMVVNHAQALLCGPPGVAAIEGDLRDPMGILGSPEVCKLIRPSEPACVVLALVLHFFPLEAAREIASAFTAWLPPGSYMIISVGCGDEETGKALIREYKAADLHNHSPGQVAGFFGGLELVPPGLVDAEDWSPGGEVVPSGTREGRILAGVGRKPVIGRGNSPSRRTSA